MKKLGAIFTVFALAAVSANAQIVIESGPFSVDSAGLDAFDCEGETKSEQLPNGVSGLAAQDDQCYPFLAQTADDFLGDGNDIVGAGWWGVYWNGTPLPPDGFRVEIYSDNGGVPGDLLFSEDTSDYNETAGDPNGYCSQLSGFNKADGVTYHMSVTAVLLLPAAVRSRHW